MRTIDVVVTPKASRNEVVPQEDGVLRIYVTVPPADGEANKKVILLLSDYYSVPKSTISIIRGGTGRKKVVQLSSLT